MYGVPIVDLIAAFDQINTDSQYKVMFIPQINHTSQQKKQYLFLKILVHIYHILFHSPTYISLK